ncbi:MAG TPA: hypothetical protein ENG48_13040 [Candidatus Atribacteria bacterium]|nr:hypothetical protein [Candidatus Atribacteria bacterium]
MVGIKFLKNSAIVMSLVLSFLLLQSQAAQAVYGNFGDLMLLYSKAPIKNAIGVKAEREVREYEETLLQLGIPQYLAREYDGRKVHDESLVKREFFYHTEIVISPHNYKEFWGMKWKRYRFTDHALKVLWPGQVATIHEWIVVDNKKKYLLPLSGVNKMYRGYLKGSFSGKRWPVNLMIGTRYGQTVRDYTNFKDFYSKFMNKHHYCITATFWSILKSMYDRGDARYKRNVERLLSNPRMVQAFDTLTAGRLIGLLLDWNLIEEY